MDPAATPPTLRDRWSAWLATPDGVRRAIGTGAVLAFLLASAGAALVWSSATGHRTTAERLLQDQADFLLKRDGKNQRGEITCPGHATILLPSRQHGPVRLPDPPGGATTCQEALDALVARFAAREAQEA